MALEISRKSLKPRFICDVCGKPITLGGSGRGAGNVVHTYPLTARQPITIRFVHRGSCDGRRNHPVEFSFHLPLEDFMEYLNASLKGKRRGSR